MRVSDVELTRSAPRDYGNRAAAVRALMLGAAGDINLGVTDKAGQRTANKGAGMPRRRDVGIVQHGMTKAAQHRTLARFGLRQ